MTRKTAETELNAIGLGHLGIVGIGDVIVGEMAEIIFVKRSFSCCHYTKDDDGEKEE